MKKFLIVLLTVFSTAVFAQDAKETDPFDLSESKSKVEKLGLVTQAEVEGLEQQAKELFNSDQCVKAVPALAEYSEKANWLANMISATLDPYYGASYDDRKEFPYGKLEPLIPLETLANGYKQKRNIAIAMRGECLVKTGQKEQAVPVLLKALDLMDIENEEWWERTRKNLLSVIGVAITSTNR